MVELGSRLDGDTGLKRIEFGPSRPLDSAVERDRWSGCCRHGDSATGGSEASPTDGSAFISKRWSAGSVRAPEFVRRLLRNLGFRSPRAQGHRPGVERPSTPLRSARAERLPNQLQTAPLRKSEHWRIEGPRLHHLWGTRGRRGGAHLAEAFTRGHELRTRARFSGRSFQARRALHPGPGLREEVNGLRGRALVL
jgi:hypothetical protein